MDVINILFSSLIVLILSAILYVKRSFSYWKSLNVPYDEPIFPYGNSKGLGKTMTILQFMNKYYTQFKGTTKMCGLYFLLRPVGMILDLDLIKNVLVKEFPSFNDRNFYYNEKDDPLSAHLGKKISRMFSMYSIIFIQYLKIQFATIFLYIFL